MGQYCGRNTFGGPRERTGKAMGGGSDIDREQRVRKAFRRNICRTRGSWKSNSRTETEMSSGFSEKAGQRVFAKRIFSRGPKKGRKNVLEIFLGRRTKRGSAERMFDASRKRN